MSYEQATIICASLILGGLLCGITYWLHEDWFGIKCEHCKCRSKEWKDWYDIEGVEEENGRGWIWCPQCEHKQWEGFQDRVFG